MFLIVWCNLRKCWFISLINTRKVYVHILKKYIFCKYCNFNEKNQDYTRVILTKMWIIVNYENKMYYFRYSSCFVEKQDFLGERHCPEDQWYNASKGSVLQATATDTGSRFYVIKESEKNSTVLTVNYEFKNSCNILWVWMWRVINMYFEGLLNIFLFCKLIFCSLPQ